MLQAAGLAGGPDTVSLRAGIAEAELDARVSVGTVVESALGVSLAARLLSGDSSGVRLTALVENVTDLPAAGALYAAAYRDGRYLGAALYPDTVTLLPGETAELPMEISCDGSGVVTLKLFFLDGETMAPLSGNQK